MAARAAMSPPAPGVAAPCGPQAAERGAARMQLRSQGRGATVHMVRRCGGRVRAAAEGAGDFFTPLSASPSPSRQRLPLCRPRQDVLEPDARLRDRLAPRCAQACRAEPASRCGEAYSR